MKVYLLNKTSRKNLKETGKYEKIKKQWIESGFENSFCIGSVKSLIEGCETFNDWKEKYFSTGEERAKLLKGLDSITRKKNTDYSWYIQSSKIPYGAVLQYNLQFGRTKEELGEFANLLKEQLIEKEIECSLEETYAVVYEQILEETWNKQH